MTRALILAPLHLLILVPMFFVLRPDPATKKQQSAPMTPNDVVVNDGDDATLRVTTNRSTEFHLHGYELGSEVEPGEVSEISFEATRTGRFEHAGFVPRSSSSG